MGSGREGGIEEVQGGEKGNGGNGKAGREWMSQTQEQHMRTL